MQIKDRNIEKLLEKYKEISLLGRINGILGWDMNVNLPPKAAEGRAEQAALITKLTVERWLDPDFRKLVAETNEDKLTKIEKAILRNLQHAGAFYFKVPKEIIIEFSESTSKAFMVWQKAKEEDKFSDFAPYLKKNIELNKIVADHLGFKENRYDALLDLYEPGLTTNDVRKIFTALLPRLTNLLKKVKKGRYNSESISNKLLVKNYPKDMQKKLALFILRKMNFDLSAGRLDVSTHPFTDTLGLGDVRITNLYIDNDFRQSLGGTMHEGGHALYEQGINEDFEGTPLEGGVSLGIHESQSKFWETQIGQSYEFVKFMAPVFHAFYAEQLADFGTEEIYLFMNQVKPDLIRIEADEVTYNLHITLRFEIEEMLVNDRIKVENLPEVWREKMKEYLGIVPKTDRQGVLQDVHWAHGTFGYFPTYTLGNLYAAQFRAAMEKEVNIGESIEKGELGTVLSWLRYNIHQYGSLYWPKELIKKATGEELNPKYFIKYLEEKYQK